MNKMTYLCRQNKINRGAFHSLKCRFFHISYIYDKVVNLDKPQNPKFFFKSKFFINKFKYIRIKNSNVFKMSLEIWM